MILGFRREVDENCALLGCYAASSGNFLPTFQNKLLVPFSGFKNPKITQRVVVISYRRFQTTYGPIFKGQESKNRPLKKGPIGWPEMSVRNYHYSLRNNTQEHSSQDTIYLQPCYIVHRSYAVSLGRFTQKLQRVNIGFYLLVNTPVSLFFGPSVCSHGLR